MSTKRFSNSHTANSPKQQIQQLIEEVKKHSEPIKRRIALTKFLQAIYQHKNLLVMPSYTMMPDYEEIHQQALQDTLLVVSQKIDSYESGKPLLPWIAGIFRNKFYDALKRHRPNKVNFISLDCFSYNLSSLSQDDLRQTMQDFLLDDPENILKTTTVRGCPHITLQKLLWLIHIEDKTWETIAAELNSKISTLSSFYQRNIQKHKAYFQKYLS